jgi:hypothetical protein
MGLVCEPGESINIKPHRLIVLIELNSETLFSDFTVISKSSVSKAVFFNATLFLDDVNDPGSIY